MVWPFTDCGKVLDDELGNDLDIFFSFGIINIFGFSFRAFLVTAFFGVDVVAYDNIFFLQCRLL